MARLTIPLLQFLKRLSLKLQLAGGRLWLKLGRRSRSFELSARLQKSHPESYDAALLLARAAVANFDFLEAASAIMICRSIDSDRLQREHLPGSCWMAPILAILQLCEEKNADDGLAEWHDPLPPIAGRRSRGRRLLEVTHVPVQQAMPSARTEDGISMDEVADVDWDLLLDQLTAPESS